MNPPAAFTASEMGRCLDCTPQNIRKALRGIPRDDTKLVSGVEAAAWHFASLPSPLVARLAKAATLRRYGTPLQLLQNAPPAQEPVQSISRIADEEIDRAQRLLRALARCLALTPSASVSARAQVASEDYRREFGHAVSDRWLREWITRVIRRDRGHRRFDRIQLYFSERPPQRKARTCPRVKAYRFDELDAHFGTLRDRVHPTLSEIAHCWREIIALISDRLTAGADEIQLKRALRTYLIQAAPFLGNSQLAIKRTLNRKLREAVEHGVDKIVDRRLKPHRKNHKPSDFDSMILLLAQHTVGYCGKRESQAYRQLHMGTAHNGDRFSEEFRSAYPFDCRKAKCEIPKCVRNAVRPMVKAMWSLHLGERAARLAMPSIHRDWSGVLAGESYTSDDATLNHLVVDWHEQGEYEFSGRRFNVIRPQFLPVVDERTDNPLGFMLAPAPNYTSWHIRTLFSRVCMRPEIGLPFNRFLVEKGIWQSRNVEALASWSAIDESFLRHGIKLSVRHAGTPKAKIVERVFGALQNLDDCAPGYIGRSRAVKYERVHGFVQRLKRFGQPQKTEVDPTEMLMTTEQCIEMLESILQRFANEPQNGERLQGLSPAEGWEQLSDGRVHHVLPEELRYLLATAESIQTVTNEGIILRIGNRKHYYCGSHQLGSLIGEKVRVRYNPELPEQVTVAHIVSDPHAQRPFSVPLFERVRAHDATWQEFARAREHQLRFVSYGRAHYRELVPRSNRTICRSEVGSPELRQAGAAHNRLERECIDLKSERESERSTIEQFASRHNLAIDASKVRRPKRVARHLKALEGLKAKIRAQEAAATVGQSEVVCHE